MKFEYKTVLMEVDRKSGFLKRKANEDCLESIDSALQRYGEEGWQMVGVFPVSDGGNPPQVSQAIHYFMRPVGK